MKTLDKQISNLFRYINIRFDGEINKNDFHFALCLLRSLKGSSLLNGFPLFNLENFFVY